MNTHLQNEVSTIFQRITRKITRGMSRVVILIDWSAYHASRFQLLRASLACDGRSLLLMSCVVSSSQMYMSVFWNRLLSALVITEWTPMGRPPYKHQGYVPGGGQQRRITLRWWLAGQRPVVSAHANTIGFVAVIVTVFFNT